MCHINWPFLMNICFGRKLVIAIFSVLPFHLLIKPMKFLE